MNSTNDPKDEGGRHPSFKEAFRFWLKLGFISFGGPTGQIAIMHTELVERRRWISNDRFLHALNFCMLLPGPEAQQLAVYIGWLLHRTWGGIVAGTLFVLPSAFLLWLLSYTYAAYGEVVWVAAVFDGLKPAVLAIVLAAVIRIGRKALRNEVMWALAGLAFVAMFFFNAPFPAVILSAAAIGWIGGRFWKTKFAPPSNHGHSAGGDNTATATRPMIDDASADSDPAHTRPSLARPAAIIAIGLALWWLPVVAAGTLLGRDHAVYQEGVFFSKAAVVTFGGAYAVLPYVAQRAVGDFGWLQAGQMLDGLGLAETTPGPLIMVVQFVGFVGAWQNPGDLSPVVAGTLGALLTTWVTFVPCFLWIFLGGPTMERLRANRRLGAALSTITAAVVGVVLNLAVWFGLHVLFPGGVPAVSAIAIGALAFGGMVFWKWNIPWVVAGGAAAGLLLRLLSVQG